MADRRAETARDIDALFHLGVVSGMTDGQLLERFARPSEHQGDFAFEAIVRRHGPMVLGVCLRALGDHHAAEDAFQATFMVLAARSRAIKKQDSLGPWLHGVAVRIARRRRDLGRRQKSVPIPADALVDRVVTDPAAADTSAVLDEELGRLPEKYRLPVVLCYLEGQTQDEAARTLGWSKGTVSGRLARAKDLLRHRLTRRGLAPTAGLLVGSLALPTARASVASSLLASTVQGASALLLGGAEVGLGSGAVASLARATIKGMLLGRVGRVAISACVLGLGAAALATPLLIPARPAPAGRDLARRPAIATSSARLDRFGDPLPPGALRRLGTVQRRHDRGVAGIAFTPDGAAAVTAQNNGVVRFWDPATGGTVRTFDMLAGEPSPDKLLRDFTISPDGKLMAAAGFAFDPAARRVRHRVWIWDAKQVRPLLAIEVPSVDLFCLAFAPDSTTLATGGFAGAVQLWDVATGESRATLAFGHASVQSLSFAPDGNVLGMCDPGQGTRLRSLSRHNETFLPNPKSGSIAPTFSPDGRLMAINSLDLDAVVVDRATGAPRRTIAGTALVFSPDSRSLVVSDPDGGTIKRIDVETGGEIWTANLGWGRSKGDVVFSPDGLRIITERGGALRFLDASSGIERFPTPEAHQGGVTSVCYTPDGRAVLTAGDDGTVRQWDAGTARQLRAFSHGGRVNRMAVSTDGTSLATAEDGPEAGVSVWDLASGARRRQWTGVGSLIGALAVAFSADGKTVLALDRDLVVRRLEIATGDEPEAHEPSFEVDEAGTLGPAVGNGAFGPANRFVALAAGTTVHLGDLASGTERFSVSAVAFGFSADGHRLAVATLGEPGLSPLADGSYRSSGQVADGVEVVDLRTFESRRFPISPDSVIALAVAPDGKLVAVASGWDNPAVRLYRAIDGREVARFACPARVAHPGGLAFAPDGRSLAAGLDDTTVVIWETRDIR